jgi:hypothetical protein
VPVDFAVSQARVDRRDGGTEPPGGKEQHHELDAVGQLEGDDIAGPHPQVAEVTRRGPDAVQELVVGERLRSVGDGVPFGVDIDAVVENEREAHRWIPAVWWRSVGTAASSARDVVMVNVSFKSSSGCCGDRRRLARPAVG